jgi:ubiquinone/menaquinone biosynthesis C-methylase UbiE
MSTESKDHFSGHADRYQAFRPTYPRALFEYLASLCPRHNLAWDCATGNGQAAVELAAHFQNVVATDFSQTQIDHANPRPNIEYRVAPADASTLADQSVDLIMVAQALHWFDLARFYAEVRRVAHAGAILAASCYELHTITPEIDAVVHHYYSEVVGADWPPERKLVEEGYKTVAFPFDEIATPTFQMVHQWTVDQVIGYLSSWSATQRYIKRTGLDPLPEVRQQLQTAWGGSETPRTVTWPLNVRVGRVR